MKNFACPKLGQRRAGPRSTLLKTIAPLPMKFVNDRAMLRRHPIGVLGVFDVRSGKKKASLLLIDRSSIDWSGVCVCDNKRDSESASQARRGYEGISTGLSPLHRSKSQDCCIERKQGAKISGRFPCAETSFLDVSSQNRETEHKNIFFLPPCPCVL